MRTIHRLYSTCKCPETIKGKRKIPVDGSSPPVVLAGHSTFSAPSNLRSFFHSVFWLIEDGKPDTTIVRIARGSLVLCAGNLGTGVSFSFFTLSDFRWSFVLFFG